MSYTLPVVEDLAADPVTHHQDDMIAPAGLTNFLGTCRVNHDLTELGAVMFPPLSQGLARTATLFVDGKLFAAYGQEVTYEWRPDRATRSADVNGWRITSHSICVPGERAVAIEIEVENLGGETRDIEIGLGLATAVTRSDSTWGDAVSPSAMNRVEVDDHALTFSDPKSDAWNIQGVDRPAKLSARPLDASADHSEEGIGGIGGFGDLSVTMSIAPGRTGRVGFVSALGASREECEATFDRVIGDVPGLIGKSEEYWNQQIREAFDPSGSEYSGALPILETKDADLRRLYWWSVLGLIWFRRDFPGNFLGRSFDTLTPNYWATTTFIWDYSLSSLTHALLDPEEMRRQLLHWMSLDIHTHFGTSSITGGPVGRWYSVNDYAMVRMVADYIRVTGDLDFLSECYDGEETVYGGVKKWASAWKGLRNGSDLADYGGIDNLLECVSTYTHEVASLNAANVWCMETAAELATLLGKDEDAREFRAEAEALLPEVMKLYIPGAGYFQTRQPDGTLIPVRHCYDFSVVGTTIQDHLDPEIREDMRRFFEEELKSDNWLHALSPHDPDSNFSVRPDHQWNGAYPAWPADAGRALACLGGGAELLEWIPGLARSANQGPMGQAHFVDEAVAPINGGARKAPPQLPYIIDWACSSSGAWLEMITEGVFGLHFGVDGKVTAGGPIAELDPDAVLRGVRIAGKAVDVHANGEVVASSDETGGRA